MIVIDSFCQLAIMKFLHIINEGDNTLIHDTYHFSIEEGDLPYNDIVILVGKMVLNYTCSKTAVRLSHYDKIFNYLEATVFGQFFGHYALFADLPCCNFGITFQPTAWYKLFGRNMLALKNNAIPLKELDQKFYDQIIPIYQCYEVSDCQNQSLKEFNDRIIPFIHGQELFIDINTKRIDKAIEIIESKQGKLKVSELLEEIPYSQKALESNFKKIVGLTPGQYIRQCRFVNLIRSYQNGAMEIKQLIDVYNYYDKSHFAKDLNFFTGKSLSEFFKADHQLIKQYI